MFRAALITFALLFCFAPPAAAQNDIARASQLLSSANKLYDGGEFRAALADYRASYNITKDDRVLYRIGLCYENLANYQRAREHLELYLLADPNTQYRARIDAKLETLRQLEATMQSFIEVRTVPAGGRVWLDSTDGRPSGIAPTRIPVGPGKFTVIVQINGREVVREPISIDKAERIVRTYDAHGAVVP